MMWALMEAIILKPCNSCPSFPTTLARVWSGTKIRPFPCFCRRWSLMYFQMRLTIWPLEHMDLPMTAWRSVLTRCCFKIFVQPGFALWWRLRLIVLKPAILGVPDLEWIRWFRRKKGSRRTFSRRSNTRSRSSRTSIFSLELILFTFNGRNGKIDSVVSRKRESLWCFIIFFHLIIWKIKLF